MSLWILISSLTSSDCWNSLHVIVIKVECKNTCYPMVSLYLSIIVHWIYWATCKTDIVYKIMFACLPFLFLESCMGPYVEPPFICATFVISSLWYLIVKLNHNYLALNCVIAVCNVASSCKLLLLHLWSHRDCLDRHSSLSSIASKVDHRRSIKTQTEGFNQYRFLCQSFYM